MTDFLKIAKSIVVHFAHICAYGVETVNRESCSTLYVGMAQHCSTLQYKLPDNFSTNLTNEGSI